MATEKDFWKSRINKWTALDPIDRLSEVLFGLIMVLTFTGTISASTAGRQDVGQLLWAALGCNFAWGLVDAIMNMMDTLLARGHGLSQFLKLIKAQKIEETRVIVKDNLSPLVAELMNDAELDNLGAKMKQLPEPGGKATLTVKDFLIAGEIFLLVFLSTFPVVLPFIFIDDVVLALRISNSVAIMLMFTAGFILAKYSGQRPFTAAMIYTGLGLLLVAITMALGG